MRNSASPTLPPSMLPWFAAAAASWSGPTPAEAPKPKARVLLIDDDRGTLELVSLYLERQALDLARVRSTEGAKVLVERGQYDLLILDWTLAGADAVDLVRISKTRRPQAPVVIFSRTDFSQSGIPAGADAVVRKGGPLEALSAAIFENLGRSQAKSQTAA